MSDDSISKQTEIPSEQSEIETLIRKIKKWIDSKNRGSADYFIIDRIEEIIDEYEAKREG